MLARQSDSRGGVSSKSPLPEVTWLLWLLVVAVTGVVCFILGWKSGEAYGFDVGHATGFTLGRREARGLPVPDQIHRHDWERGA